MQKSFIKISSRDITSSDLRAMLNSQMQILALTEQVDAARHNKLATENEVSTEKILSELKKIIS